ncbi:acetyl-CoA C-acyltransferase [Sinorhizobium medicae]|uniref:acetyl-CoA C-acetyltransferase n=1 Tax=Sinorhizobium medicae TaxID=110321 RepID=UPI0012965FD8|nr:acetyl-CoA C-acetyltransferase [Sinorhizobium medicae]MDX1017313.1 acetyl-CoA C-acyltransferase [Sinorhizobium medicae]MDX2388276.1 acetyl-CoA C-acyltransferase [Sinorhizobium medicae]MQU76308.1 acetyl-CoA C-acyltransferase [Sinorhizobium medicae]
MSTPSIVIASAARTAVGSFNGAFANTPAHELGAAVIKGVLERAGVDAKEVDEVILGQVLPAGEGQNPARQAAMKAGIPQEATAWGVNQLCGSGLRAVALGLQQIATGDAKIIVAGGQESMSMAPHCAHLRSGVKMGDFKIIDTMITDGLTDAFHGYHMGITAENIARQFQLTREEQDAFALASQNKAAAAQKAGRFANEIVPFTVKTRTGDITVDQDEYVRHGATLESIAKLRPAFDKEGTVTAGNASGINDGAAAALLMSDQEAARRGIQPLARIVSWATAGVDPSIMGAGPIPASRKALQKAGWSINQLDLVEANEAFAAQGCAVNKDLGWNPDIINVNGGAISIGHPIGASGARVLNTLLFEMKRRGAKKGLATLCIGGGMGVAMCVEAM